MRFAAAVPNISFGPRAGFARGLETLRHLRRRVKELSDASSFHCLMFSGLPFSEEVREFLLDTARRMRRGGVERQPFKFETYEGEVRTKFTPFFVSTHLQGILFTAEVECEGGKTSVRFLVTPRELKKKTAAKWGPWLRAGGKHPRDNAVNN